MAEGLRALALAALVAAGATGAVAQTEVDVHLQPGVTPPSAEQSEEFNKTTFFGKKFFDLGDFASAEAQFNRANEIVPDRPGVLYDLAVIFARQGKFAEAQEKIDRYTLLYPGGAERALIDKLQLELDFQRELQRKQQADLDYAELFNRGKFQFDKGNYKEALEIFRNAEKQRPNDPATLFNQALTLEALGDYVQATDRLRRYLAVKQNPQDKVQIDEKIFSLESEVEDQATKFVCPFCGNKLAHGATWCPRCWHGPYLPDSPIWNTRICGRGATATRTTYYSDGRIHQNEDLDCLIHDRNFAATLPYSRARQRAIQDARKAEGWTYSGDVIQSLEGDKGTIFKLKQDGSLETLYAYDSGDVLNYHGHQTDDGRWLLDDEEYMIDGQKYAKHYDYDGSGRITRETVRYHNMNACGHIITIVADYQYQGETLQRVLFTGSYDGYLEEGTPKAEWKGALAWTYDEAGRVSTEEFNLDSYTKTYTTDMSRDKYNELRRLHPGMRTRRPIDVLKTADYCSVVGSKLVANQIDLRPFYTISPNIAILLPTGVTRIVTTFTYPQGFSIR